LPSSCNSFIAPTWSARGTADQSGAGRGDRSVPPTAGAGSAHIGCRKVGGPTGTHSPPGRGWTCQTFVRRAGCQGTDAEPRAGSPRPFRTRRSRVIDVVDAELDRRSRRPHRVVPVGRRTPARIQPVAWHRRPGGTLSCHRA
jgi:hypothetical protein